MHSFEQASAYIGALTRADPETASVAFRCIHDTDKAVAAIPLTGTLRQCWQSLRNYQTQGYGIFCEINVMVGGRELHNVQSIRAHVVDLDNISAVQNYRRTQTAQPAPSFGVNTSPGKHHSYWIVEPYADVSRYTPVQRALRQVFDGDRSIIDPTRVLRLPGSYNLKRPDTPHAVTCEALAGFGVPVRIEQLEAALAGVTVIDGGSSERHALGDPDLAAPSWEWAKRALELTDPNSLDRAEWVSILCGFKQAAWNVASEADIWTEFSNWCARYELNDPAENKKQFASIRSTSLGWRSLTSRVPSLRAMFHLDKPVTVPAAPDDAPMPMPEPQPLDCSGEMLTHLEQAQWFKGVTFVTNLGEMLTADNRFLNASQFNAVFGGKQFIINQASKVTDEAWKAATRSSLWKVPVVDHIRFLPSRPYGEVVADDIGRRGVNMYKPMTIQATDGDASPFTRHIAAMLPDPSDQKILLDYLAHNVRYPGVKIPWAPVIQSVEGAGKGVLKLVMRHCMGKNYTYFPDAKQLGDSGSKFNAWMRNRLFILADEIKVDDRLDMIETLKPFISEETIEIQGKGQDQDIEDNFSNWLFFSNWKNAIPVNKNGRRFAIFYSQLQTAQDLLDRQMGDAYFKALYAWLKGPGSAIVAHYLLNYPIANGDVPMRAPNTSSTGEALRVSQGPVERLILDAVSDGVPGFMGGWVSSVTLAKHIRAAGSRQPAAQTLETIMAGLGYVLRGRAPKPYFAESGADNLRSTLWHVSAAASVEDFAAAQGWVG